MSKSGARRQADQALAVPATPANAVDGPQGFDPSRTSIAGRLNPKFKVVFTSSAEESSIQVSGPAQTRDELSAVIETLTLLREWLPSEDYGEGPEACAAFEARLTAEALPGEDRDAAMERLVSASGMEARRAETGTGSVHDSPTAESGDAQQVKPQ